MTAKLELKPLSEETFADYETITKNEGGCGCGYERAGFERPGAHWLSSAEAPRSIYRLKL